MEEKFFVPINIWRYIDWERFHKEFRHAEMLTITATREGHGEELIGYEIRIKERRVDGSNKERY